MSNHFLKKKQWKNQGALFSKRRPKRVDYIAFDRSIEESNEDGVLFVFNNENVEDSTTDEINHRRERKPVLPVQNFMEKTIQMDDTLASLALRYGCSVAELKRINNFLSDQEMHGLRKIKVPIKPFSLLLDLDETNSSSPGENVAQVHNLSIGSSLLPDDGKSFLRAMDEDLERIRKSTRHYKASLEDVTAELTCKRFHPITNDQHEIHRTTTNYRCYAIGWILVISIVIPALVIFFYIQLQ